jgi:60 kDa SS-A/Ro ribonucleoprotein
MSNNNLFKSNPGNVKDANTVNEAGGKAYSLSDKAALAQYALTGTFHGTFYSTDKDQLKTVLELASKCDVEFVAKLAVYARQEGLMKDTPAVLTAVVANKSPELLKKIFPLTINDPKMLRNFVQVIRSGVVGRKSLGSAPKKLVQNFLSNLSDEQLFCADVGNNPTLADIIKMVHPKAANETRNALYGYLLNKDYNKDILIPLARSFEAFKSDMNADLPRVPFQMLTALPLTSDHWKSLAKRASWNQIRQNLNSFARHEVFNDKEALNVISNKIQDAGEVKRARVFPYQLFSTFINLDETVPMALKIGIQNAGEIAIENVPTIEGNVIIALDVSGSMKDPVTGRRGTATTKMRCVDVASMFAAAIIRKNPLARVIPFDTVVKNVELNPLDTVMTNAAKLAASGANGGTDCGVVLAQLNEQGVKADLIVMISDNQSWVQSSKTHSGETNMMREWSKFHHRNHNAKLVNIDITPYGHTQVYDQECCLNVGGFSDQVFEVVANFAKGGGEGLLVKTIDAINLE